MYKLLTSMFNLGTMICFNAHGTDSVHELSCDIILNDGNYPSIKPTKYNLISSCRNFQKCAST